MPKVARPCWLYLGTALSAFAGLSWGQPGSAGWPEGTTPTATSPQAPGAEASAVDPAVVLEVERLLASMAHAVTTQDVDAYMALISESDAEFRNEQLYFARDFAKPGKYTKECAITLDAGTLQVGDGSAYGEVMFTWTQEPEAAPATQDAEDGEDAPAAPKQPKPPQERSISFTARFDDENGVWKYGGEKWLSHEAPGVRVLFDEGLEDHAAAVAEGFRDIRAGVEKAFGLETTDFPTRVKSIKLYGRMKHLQHSICLSYTDGLSGWNEPGEPLKILASRRGEPTPAGFHSVLAHEYGHCATFELGPKSNDMPWWILEGVAEVMTEQVDERSGERAQRAVERWSRRGELAPWPDLADFENVPRRFRGHVYTQGHAMMAFITREWGESARTVWMSIMSKGGTIDDACNVVMGMTFAELDARWRNSLPAEGSEEPPKGDAPGQKAGS